MLFVFQFPTGWNSTKRHRHSKQLWVVSIPNGMEFYKTAVTITSIRDTVSIPNGMEFYNLYKFFNSFREKFQFPTGWNSTTPKLMRKRPLSRFNSQRDGILLNELNEAVEGGTFQFPTGWNSTLWDTCKKSARFVSIPNGMEFYFNLFFGIIYFLCFNSQRDGILPYKSV